MKRLFALKSHANNAPDHYFKWESKAAGDEFGVEVITKRSQGITLIIVTGYQIKNLSDMHKKIRKRVSISGFLHSYWIDQLLLN